MSNRGSASFRGRSWRLRVAALAGALGAGVLAPVSAYAAAPSSHPQSYLVRAVPGGLPQVRAEIASVGGRATRSLDIINGIVAELPPRAVAPLRADAAVAAVTPNRAVHLSTSSYTAGSDGYSLYSTQNAVQARAQWATATGRGVDVALVDSGVAPVTGLNNSGQVVNGPDLTPESRNPTTANLDTFGHGTFMAGIIAGHDPGVTPAATNSSAFMGVAPNARIVSVKAADARGGTDVSQVLAGIDWVVKHAHDPGFNIRVLNLSFGTDSSQSYLVDPLAYATEVAWRAGIVVVVSAGNSGKASGQLEDPAFDPYVIAVAAGDTAGTVDSRDDQVASFSSLGDGTRNPDVMAPGTHVQSLRVPGSYIDTQYSGTGLIAGDTSGRFFRGSGTSEAAAMVSGEVALLLQARPTLTPDQVKEILRATAKKLTQTDQQGQGNGLTQLSAAMTVKASSTPQSFPQSTGTGTLEGSRGSAHLVDTNGIVLSGEQDLMGQPFNSAAMASAESAGTAWTGGVWNGRTWAGSGWSGRTWAAATWTGSDWAGRTWAGRTWASGTWDGRTWANGSWAGRTWAGATWAASGWSGRVWDGRTWR